MNLNYPHKLRIIWIKISTKWTNYAFKIQCIFGLQCSASNKDNAMQCIARYTESLSTANEKKRNRIKRNENIAKPCIGFQLHAITINKRAYEFLHITTSMVVGSRLFQCSTLFLFTIHWLLLCCLPFWLSYAFFVGFLFRIGACDVCMCALEF